MSKEAIIQEAMKSMRDTNQQAAIDVMQRGIAEGLDPVEILAEGFSQGIRDVGDLFGRGRMFLPELMLAADAMKAVSEIVDAEMAKSGKAAEKKGTMILATVQGDVHDIGKGIVASLIKTQGIDVIDLGRDVAVESIIAAAEENNADIIGTSALLTTTLGEQQKLEEELKNRGLKEKYKTMVGGAPATQRWADRIGANAYAEDAAEGLNKALELLGK